MSTLLYAATCLITLLTQSATHNWAYQQTTDKTGGTVHKASLVSPTVLNFGFPYAGGSTATLTIRKRAGSTTLYLQVSKGQFNRSFQGGNARLRFDNTPAKTYAWSAAENGSASIIFFDAAEPLIAKLKTARTLSIDIDFYAQGRRKIDFQTIGLVWNH